MTTPCLRVVLASYARSSSLEHSLESSEKPHLAPPQSSLTRSPARVMPYRSHVQQLETLPLDTELGDELLDEREVSDGTDESRSLSESKYESSELVGDIEVRPNCDESWSSDAWLYCESTIWRVWFGLTGVGATILDGESERPLGMDAVLTRRALRAAASAADELLDVFVRPGMSRMLSLRPVVGSVVWSLAGSCETW